MKLIPLTQGQFALVDDADFERVSQHKWLAKKNNNGGFYANRSIAIAKGVQRGQQMHTFILGYERGDHKDGNGLNNQRENLRPATRAQNAYNRGKSRFNTSGFKGVFKNGNGWIARISNPEGGLINLGTYPTKEEAARAYDAKCRELHGEFANLNFPD